MPEHLDTSCIIDKMSPWESHGTAIFVKLRPFGRYDNQSVMEWIPSIRRSSRDPVSLGEVEEVFHPISLRRWARETNARSSRTGKEQMGLKISGFGREMKVGGRDLRTGKICAIERGRPFDDATGRCPRPIVQHRKR